MKLEPQLASPKSNGTSQQSTFFTTGPKVLLQQQLGKPKTPPKSQSLEMPPPLCKEQGNQEKKEDAESNAVVRNLDL